MSGTETGQHRPRRVLIAEDNELNLRLFNDLLDYHGYETTGTTLGETGIGLAIDHPPDLILLDIQLPDILGTDVERRFKADERTQLILIIAVTAFAMSGDRARSIESGCDDYSPNQSMLILELIARYASRSFS